MIDLTKIKAQQWFKVKSIVHPMGDYYFKCVGIGVGDKVKIIRKAPFNGPLHVKTNLGAEFAIDRESAELIYVEEIFLP